MEKKRKGSRKNRFRFCRPLRKAAVIMSVSVLGLLFTATPCMAAETDTVEQSGGSAGRSVYAQYESAEDEGISFALVTDGSAAVTLPDGTVISVSGDIEDGLYLKVFPIPEETDGDSAWQWFVQQMEGKGTNMRPYDIWFEDAYGQEQEVNGELRVAVTLPIDSGYENPAVYCQPAQGEEKLIESTYSDGAVIFRITHNDGYYVLLEKAVQSGGTDEEADDNTTPGGKQQQSNGRQTDSPQTGDWTNVSFFFGIMAVSAFLAIGCAASAGRKKRGEIG